MNHFLSSEIDNCPAEEALFHVIPAPLEQSVSYGSGTARGPEAILAASDQLETWDGQSEPCNSGIYTTRSAKGESAELFLNDLETLVDKSLQLGKVPVVLGGEHTVSLAAARAVFKRHGDRVGLVQIDAHADLRSAYEGNPLSHASVIRRIHELTGWQIYQMGIRALCREELDYQRSRNIHCLSGEAAAVGQVHELVLPDDFPELVYLTIDADGLDSSILPATGTPVPGGLLWYQTLSLLRSVAEQRRVIGFDFVELAPQPPLQFCDFSAAQLVYNVMGMIQRSE